MEDFVMNGMSREIEADELMVLRRLWKLADTTRKDPVVASQEYIDRVWFFSFLIAVFCTSAIAVSLVMFGSEGQGLGRWINRWFVACLLSTVLNIIILNVWSPKPSSVLKPFVEDLRELHVAFGYSNTDMLSGSLAQLDEVFLKEEANRTLFRIAREVLVSQEDPDPLSEDSEKQRTLFKRTQGAFLKFGLADEDWTPYFDKAEGDLESEKAEKEAKEASAGL